MITPSDTSTHKPMGNNDSLAVQLAAFDLMRVDSQSLTTVIEAGLARAQLLKGDEATRAYFKYAMRAAKQGTDADESHALFTRAQIYLECTTRGAQQLEDAGLPVASETTRARLIFGLAHAHVKMAPRLDGATRVNYNIGEIIQIAKSLPARH